MQGASAQRGTDGASHAQAFAKPPKSGGSGASTGDAAKKMHAAMESSTAAAEEKIKQQQVEIARLKAALRSNAKIAGGGKEQEVMRRSLEVCSNRHL